MQYILTHCHTRCKGIVVAMIFIMLSLLYFVQPVWGQDGSCWWNTDYTTTEGTKFWITFMRNRGNDENDVKDLHLILYATSRQDNRIRVYDSSITLIAEKTIKAESISEQIEILPSDGYIAIPEQISSKGIFVESDSPISLYALNNVNGSYDAANIYPISGLYKEYVIQTYNTDVKATEFAIVSTKDDTQIEINIKETEYGEPKEDFITYESSKVTYKTIEKTLDKKGMAYIYRSSTANASLAGTTICSNSPIVVFHGGQHSQIHTLANPDNHIFSQAFSTDKWGKEFIISYLLAELKKCSLIKFFNKNVAQFVDF